MVLKCNFLNHDKIGFKIISDIEKKIEGYMFVSCQKGCLLVSE